MREKTPTLECKVRCGGKLRLGGEARRAKC